MTTPPPSLDVDDVMLTQRISYGVVVTAVDGIDARAAVAAASAAGGRLPPLA